jgi:three-Cys-motif partner protein
MKINTNRQSIEWFNRNIKRLLSSSDGVISINNVHYPGHDWTIVKLLLLAGWVYVYTTIVPKHFKKYQYVDLLAGSGTTLVEETQDVVVGSPFIAHYFARNEFTNYVYIERLTDRCQALRQRASMLLSNNFEVFKGDCNDIVKSIFTDEKCHSLVFIDNEGFDVYWETIETVLRTNSDILILFPTASVKRVATERTRSCLDRFYGNSSWLNAHSFEEFLEIYVKQLTKEFRTARRKEGYVSSVHVGGEQYFYDVILVCRRGPYTNAWEYLKRKLDWKDPEIIKTTLDILKNRITSMDWFIDYQKQVEFIGHGKSKNDNEKKTKLDRFLSQQNSRQS